MRKGSDCTGGSAVWLCCIAALGLALCANACGSASLPAQAQEAQIGRSLPALPAGDADQPQRAASKEHDNVLYGKEYFDKATPGADVSDTRMVLYGPGSEKGAWAMYQWSGFVAGLLPNSITVDIDIAAGREYWLLLSDYSSGRWKILGPLTSAIYTFDYDSHVNYSSPAGNTYAVVMVDRENAALLNKLNLKANKDIDPPAPPSGLRVDNIMSHTADLHWDLNPDADTLGYKLYRGPDSGFDKQDPGVTVVDDNIDYLTHDFALSGLDPDTQYYYKLSAFDVAFNESRLSEVCTFKTPPNVAPQPVFTWTPNFVQVEREVVFDPTGTTDPGDDLSRELFQWDFDNDGTIDAQTTGPELVPHVYHERRTYECRLVVSDGTFDVPLVHSIQVSFRYDYYDYGRAGGFAAQMVNAATDPATGRIAVLANTHAGFGAYYYDGGAWEWLPFDDLPSGVPAGIKLSPDGLAIMMLDEGFRDCRIYEYSAGTFTFVMNAGIQPVFAFAAMAVSPAGRYSIVVVDAQEPAPGEEASFELHCTHARADGGVTEGNLAFGLGNVYPCDIQRDDAATYVAIANGSIKLMKLDDAAAVVTDEQAMPAATSIALYESPSAPGELTWVAGASDGSLVWGDNFGAPNGGGQTVFLADPATYMLGLRSAGDNEAEFYWDSLDSRSISHLRGYDSASDSSYDLGQGYGLASFGQGGALADGPQSGVYFAVYEERDGQITGYFADHGSFLRKETIYNPSGTSPVLGYSYPVIFPDGSLSVFCQQPYPTAIRAHAEALDQPFVKDTCGDDNYVIPSAACATGVADGFIIASQSDLGDIVVTHFASDAVTGEEKLVLADATSPVIQRSPYTGEVMLACAAGFNSEDIKCVRWDGSAWSAPELVYDGSVTVMQLTLRPRPDGGWGIGFGLDSDQLWLIENAGSGWGIPEQLSNQLLNDYCGVGLGYSADGDCAVAVERGNPQKLWLGERAAGDSAFTWSLLNDSTNGFVRETALFYEGGARPVVFYYLHKQFSSESGIYVYENIDGEWNLAQFDFIYYETPMGTAVDPEGNIVVSGIRGIPADAVYTVIWR